MKITLIYPRFAEGYRSPARMEPLILAILAAITPGEHTVQAIDERLEEVSLAEDTDLVAISVCTFSAKRAYGIAASYRQKGVPVVLGGFHPTLQPEEAMAHADAVVVGDAEATWPQVVADAAAGRLQRLYAPAAPGPMMAATPDRSVFRNKSYLPIRLVQFGRGCPRACDFCAIHAFYGSAVRHRPVASVVEELKADGAKRVLFVDDNLLANHGAFRSLMEAILPLGLRWSSQMDLSIADKPDLLDLARRSGCQSLLIGLESLNENNLKQMGKTWNHASSFETRLARIRRAGIMIYGTFLFGYDEDDPGLLQAHTRVRVATAVLHREFQSAPADARHSALPTASERSPARIRPVVDGTGLSLERGPVASPRHDGGTVNGRLPLGTRTLSQPAWNCAAAACDGPCPQPGQLFDVSGVQLGFAAGHPGQVTFAGGRAMRILFIKPNMGLVNGRPYDDRGRMEPLTFAALAGFTPERHEVCLCDDRFEPVPYNETWDLVGITVEIYMARRAYEIADRFRALGVKVIVGGPHVTLIPAEASQHADAIALGDIDAVWQTILDDAEAGCLKPVYHGLPLDGTELKQICLRRDIFKGKPYLPVTLTQFSRGCSNFCEYCATGSIYRGRFPHRSPKDVVNELARTGRKFIFFVDDNLIADVEAAKVLFRKLIPLKLRWIGQASLKFASDPELMDLMVRSGCAGLVVGFESGTPPIWWR